MAVPTPDENERMRIDSETGSFRATVAREMGIVVEGENPDGSGTGPLYRIMHSAVGRWAQGSLVHESNFGTPENVERLVELEAIKKLNAREADEAGDEFEARFAQLEAENERLRADLEASREAASKPGPVNEPDRHPAMRPPERTNPPESTGAAVPMEHPERAGLAPDQPSSDAPKPPEGDKVEK
jgi:hypothetical protein